MQSLFNHCICLNAEEIVLALFMVVLLIIAYYVYTKIEQRQSKVEDQLLSRRIARALFEHRMKGKKL